MVLVIYRYCIFSFLLIDIFFEKVFCFFGFIVYGGLIVVVF